MTRSLYEKVTENLKSMTELGDDQKMKIVCETVEDFIRDLIFELLEERKVE